MIGSVARKEDDKGETPVGRPVARRLSLLWRVALCGVAAFLAFGCLWLYLRMTTDEKVVAYLHQGGYPASMQELEGWRRADLSNQKEYEALRMEVAHIFQKEEAREDPLIRTTPWGELPYCPAGRRGESFDDSNLPLLEADDLYYQNILQSMRPLFPRLQKFADASIYDSGISYASLSADQELMFAVMSAHHLLVESLLAEAGWQVRREKSRGSALQTLQTAMHLIDHLKCRDCRELSFQSVEQQMVLEGAYEILCAPEEEFGPAPSPAALRKFAEELTDPARLRSVRDNLPRIYAGGFARLQDWILRHKKSGEPPARDRSESAATKSWDRIRFYFLQDIDHWQVLQAYQEVVDASALPYPQGHKAVAEAFLRLQYGGWLSARLLFFSSRLNNNTSDFWMLEQSYENYYVVLALRRMVASACLLLADRLEGKEWKEGADNLGMLADPFTGAALQLLVQPDGVLIISTGSDQKLSAQDHSWTQGIHYSDSFSGRMCDGKDDFDDDIILKIPFAVIGEN